MTDEGPGSSLARGPGRARRTSIPIGPETALAGASPLQENHSLPILIRSPMPGILASAWARTNRTGVDAHLLRAGAVLLRGFDSPGGAGEFEALMAGLYPSLVTEHERSSPRHRVSGNVYTSTDHPADQDIFLHNEMSYSHTWPMRIGFYCLTQPETGGETPIADTREVLRLIPMDVRAKFAEKGVMYVRNYNGGLGLPWQESFQTSDHAVVEDYCRRSGMVAEWKDGNGLRTRRVGTAMACHPVTRETVWFNHATFFHVSTLDPLLRDTLLADLSHDDVPTNSFYGDGAPIEEDVLDTLRDAYRRASTSFPWQGGDILLIDNMLTAHGRAPYRGPRQILVAMAEPVTERETIWPGPQESQEQACGFS